MTKNIVILGTTSSIALHTSRYWAKEKANLFLVGRDDLKLSRIKEDLVTFGATRVVIHNQDLLDESTHPRIVEEVTKCFDNIDHLLIAHGTLLEPSQTRDSVDMAFKEIRSNYLSQVSLLILFSKLFEKQKSGNMGVISSVAGDRGRMSNFVYGSAKGGLSVFSEGLRNHLYHHGVSLTLVKPGMVATPMTSALGIKSPLLAKPEVVGMDIAKAMTRHKKVVYTPFYWRIIMTIIRHIPSVIFDRLKL